MLIDKAKVDKIVGIHNTHDYRNAYRYVIAMDIKPLPNTILGWYRLLWGMDIFVNRIPLLKVSLLAHIAIVLVLRWLL